MKFECPHCKQRLEADDALAGEVIECPSCGHSLTLPQLQRTPVVAPPSRSAPPPRRAAPAAKKRSGPGRSIVFLLLLALAAFAYASWKFQESPQQLWERIGRFVETPRSPAPAATPAPAIAEAPATPLPQPSITPTPQPDRLGWLQEHRDYWPEEVTLLRAAEFPVVYQGRVAGKTQMPAGTAVTLLEIGRDDVVVAYREGKRRLPVALTDLRARAEIAFTRSAWDAKRIAEKPASEQQSEPIPEPPQPQDEAPIDESAASLPPPPAPAFGTSQQTVRVTTWNLEWFPNGSPKDASPAQQAKRIAAAAGVIRQLDPDILLLQEIKDLDACTRLAEAIKPGSYKVAICSAFRERGEIGRQQVAVLAKEAANAAWAEEWQLRGNVDPPRGFAFAWFRFRGGDLGVYSLHLKSNRGRGADEKAELIANIRKREVATEQLASHVQGVLRSKAPSVRSVVIGGDLNTNPDDPRFATERTIQLLLDVGFRNAMELLPKASRATLPGGRRYPATTFDYLLARDASFKAPRILKSRVSDHYPVTCDFQLTPTRR